MLSSWILFIFNLSYLHSHWLSLNLRAHQDIKKDKQLQKDNIYMSSINYLEVWGKKNTLLTPQLLVAEILAHSCEELGLG